MTSGHLFVVHGRLETLSADVVAIPTDALFNVWHGWLRAAGLQDTSSWDEVRPPEWRRSSIAPSRRGPDAGDPDVWFLDSVVSSPQEVGDLARRLIEKIVRHDGERLAIRARRAGRDVPLVALPVISTGYGGHHHVRGQVISELLKSLHATARRAGVDVAVVAADSRDYAALQHRRRALALTDELAEDADRAAKDLGRRAAKGDVALFFGAGVSIAAGLPSWKALLSELVDALGLQDIADDIAGLGPLEQAELIQVTVADRTTAGPEASQRALGERVVEILQRQTRRPSLSHVLLASMHLDEAVTTNYDALYEDAVAATTDRSDERGRAIRVLPWDRASSASPWLLKMHGDLEKPDSIVLSRSSFVHYDSRWKPVGALVQSLMMTKHLLVVGASLTDENLLRFAYEVAGLRASIESSGTDGSEIGTVVHLWHDEAFSRLWEGRFKVEVPRLCGDDERRPSKISRDSCPQRQEERDEETRQAARALTIFLDVASMHAVEQAPFLLDQRYAAERPGEAGRLVAVLNDAARLARELATADGEWEVLAKILEDHGAH